jgi:predicted RNA-binding Zn-ribbon protein involved in translation (DUF1610 family)
MHSGGILHESLLCPNCGDFVDHLSDTTGWCKKCSSQESFYICQRCGEDFKSDTQRPYCTYCRDLHWLEEHADEIEEYMIEGCSFSAARARVSANHKPVCLACGSPLLKQGYFCIKPECRSLYRKYHRKRMKGMSTQAALEQVLHDHR